MVESGLGWRALTPVLQLAPEAEHKPTAPASLRRVINNLSLLSVDRAFCLDQKHQRLERHLSARGRFTAGLASRAVSAWWRWVYAFPSLIDRTPERGDHAHPSQFFLQVGTEKIGGIETGYQSWASEYHGVRGGGQMRRVPPAPASLVRWL